MSKALERDRAWLELEDRPTERIIIEEELLDSDEDPPISKSAYSSFIAKSNKGLSTPEALLFGNLLEKKAIYPVMASGGIILALSGLIYFQLQSLRSNCLRAAASQIKHGSDRLSADKSRAAFEKTVVPKLGDSTATAKHVQYSRLAVNTISKIKPSTFDLSKTELQEIALTPVKGLQEKAYAALRAGKRDLALAALVRAIRLEPNNPTNRHYMTFALASIGAADQAIQQLYAWEKLADVSPDDEIALANVLVQTEQGARARDVFEHIVQKHSNNAPALVKVASNCCSLGYASQALYAIGAGMQVGSESEKADLFKIKAALDRTNRTVESPPRTTQRSVYKG